MCGNCEDCVCDKMPEEDKELHQIHLTFENYTDEDQIANEKTLRALCKQFGVKFIKYYLGTTGDFHVMTSSTVSVNNRQEALIEAYKLEKLFTNAGFPPIRKKIEIKYSADNEYILYDEAHFTFLVDDKILSTYDLFRFPMTSGKSKIGISFNETEFFKSGMKVVSLTFRKDRKVLLDTFTTHFEAKANAAGFPPLKVRYESCWYDDNVELDESWLK